MDSGYDDYSENQRQKTVRNILMVFMCRKCLKIFDKNLCTYTIVTPHFHILEAEDPIWVHGGMSGMKVKYTTFENKIAL
jgi:hypothetical protein